MSHIYCLIVVCHLAAYRGDRVIVLPKFEMKTYLEAIQAYKVNTLSVVPPIIIFMTKSKELLKKYDMSSVKAIYTGAAPLGEETAQDLQSMYPSWAIR